MDLEYLDKYVTLVVRTYSLSRGVFEIVFQSPEPGYSSAEVD